MRRKLPQSRQPRGAEEEWVEAAGLTGCPGKHVAARTGVAEGGWGQGPRSPKYPGIQKEHEEEEPPQVNTAPVK